MSKALVLTGGSIKGAFQVGVLAEMVRQNPDTHFDYIVGTSVGALNAAFILDAMEVRGTFASAVQDLHAIWNQKIRQPSDIAHHRGWLNIGLDIARGKWSGLVDVSPLERLIRQEIALSYPIYRTVVEVTAVGMEYGGIYFARQDDPYLRDFVLASAMLPITMPPRRINADWWYDGGIRDVGGVARAMALGHRDITVIACQTRNNQYWNKQPDVFNLTNRVMEIVTNELVNSDIHPVVLSDKYAIYRPLEDLNIQLERFNAQDISRVIQAGVESYRIGSSDL
jgi:NTE family protein